MYSILVLVALFFPITMTAVMLMLARSIQWKYIVGALDDRKYVYIKYDRRVHTIRVTLIIAIIIIYYYLLFFSYYFL